MQRYYGEKRDVHGRVEPYATVSVFESGTDTLATIYDASDTADTPSTAIVNPLQTDANGRYGFAAQNGDYDIVCQGSGSQEYRVRVNLFDSTTSSATGAGGNNTEVQYNSGGVLTGASGLTTDGNSLTAKSVKFNTSSPVTTLEQGNTYWDDANGTISTVLDATNNVILQHGQEVHIACVNKTGSIIANGKAVYINDAQGNRPTCALAKADSLATCQVVGVATQDIGINKTGLITVLGKVNDVNTFGYSADGVTLYLSAVTAGELTETAPSSPNYVVRVGLALNTTPSGAIFVNPNRALAADTTMAANTNAVPPTQKAAKAYADGVLTTAEAYTDTLRSNLASTSDVTKGDALIGVKSSLTGGSARTQHDKNSDSISAKDFGAIGNGVDDDTAALNYAFAAASTLGVSVDGLGKTYKVTPDTIIDTVSTGQGYGASKKWFLAGVCQNIKFVGDVSFGDGANYFLGKHRTLQNVEVTGDVRFSAWYCDFVGFTISGKSWFGGDYPPNANSNGFYFNTFRGCDFNGNCVFDQRYGNMNNNGFMYCQFKNMLVTNSGTTGWVATDVPDFHLNWFQGCEFYTTTGNGLTGPDGSEYCFVIDASATVNGINTLDHCYMESDVRGFYATKGLQVKNLHTSGVSNGASNGGGSLGYDSELTGESAGEARDVPNIYPIGNIATGGDWSILGTTGIPPCLSSGATLAVTTDAQEPTGLGKCAQFTSAAADVTISPSISGTGLKSFAVVYKVVSGSPIIIAKSTDGVTDAYGYANTTALSNGWMLAYGHTYGTVRFNSGSAYVIKISAISMGRGAGLISPYTIQPGGLPLMDLSGGSLDYIGTYLRTGYSAPYYRARTKTMSSTSGNVDWFSIDLTNYSGKSAVVEVNFSLASGGSGARVWYRKSVINENGSPGITEQNLHSITGVNGTLSFVLSGATLTVRTTTTGTAETARMSILVQGYLIGSSNITEL